MIENFMDVFFVVMIVLAVIAVGLYFLNKKLAKRMGDAQSFIQQSKQVVSVYVIEKRHDKITNVNMPAAVMEQVPSYQKLFKNYFVKVKIGPQFATLMCDKHVYNAIPEKKTVKIELAGIYIVSVVGMKSKEEMKQIKKENKKNNKNK